MSDTPILKDAIAGFLENFSTPDKERTHQTYKTILGMFYDSLGVNDDFMVDKLTETMVTNFVGATRGLAIDTRHLYAAAIVSFLSYQETETPLKISMSKLKTMIKKKIGKKPVQDVVFPENEVEKLIDYAIRAIDNLPPDEMERLRLYRDRALIILLADTGLRIREACMLKRGDINFEQYKVSIIGKGNRKALVRFSERAGKALKDYLETRAFLDGETGKSLRSLPVFLRHDLGAKKIEESITTATGRNILKRYVTLALGENKTGRITPHTLRHRFVTRVLKETKNLKTAQKLARHVSITSTQRYAHLADSDLDEAYYDTFEN